MHNMHTQLTCTPSTHLRAASTGHYSVPPAPPLSPPPPLLALLDALPAEPEDAATSAYMEEERGAYEGDLFDAHEPRPWLPGRLASRIKEWRAITSNSYVLSIVATGYSMRREWSSLGEPPPCIKRNNPNCQNHRTFISGAVADMLAMGVVRKRTLEQVHTCLPLNVDVKKSNGKLRLIFDGRYVNIYMLRKHFKMEALHAQGRTVFGGC